MEHATRLKKMPIPAGGRTWDLWIPEDPDELLEAVEEGDFHRDERMPYWGEIWPSSWALADFINETRKVRGRSTLELGCGLGLPSLSAAAAGARVLATDYFPEALELLRRNACEASLDLDTAYLDWREPEHLEGFDLVMGADLLYEHRSIEPLIRLLSQDLRWYPEILIADPRRATARPFAARLARLGFEIETHERRVPGFRGVQTIRLYTARRIAKVSV